MEEYKVAVTTKLVNGKVTERLVTVRADTIEVAWENLRLLERLAVGENGASESMSVCPQHGRARRGKGGKLYCPTPLPDGSWCKWRG